MLPLQRARRGFHLLRLRAKPPEVVYEHSLTCSCYSGLGTRVGLALLLRPALRAKTTGKVFGFGFSISRLPNYSITNLEPPPAPTPGFTQFHPRLPNVTQGRGPRQARVWLAGVEGFCWVELVFLRLGCHATSLSPNMPAWLCANCHLPIAKFSKTVRTWAHLH